MYGQEELKKIYLGRLRELAEEAGTDGEISDRLEAVNMEFEATASAEEVAGYYICAYEDRALDIWHENTALLFGEGQETEQDRQVEQMLAQACGSV